MILPEGTYNVEIQPTSSDIDRRSGKYILVVQMYVIDGEHQGKTITSILYFGENHDVADSLLRAIVAKDETDSGAYLSSRDLNTDNIASLMAFKIVTVDISVERDFDRHGTPRPHKNHVREFRRYTPLSVSSAR